MKRKLTTSVLAAVMLAQAGVVPALASEKVDVSRVSGNDRYDTAIEISKKSFETAENVVLASGEQFPDALAGGVLASVLKAPVLLTKSSEMSSKVSDEIKRLKAKNIYILGGENSVSREIESNLAKEYKIKRISGTDRYDTSVRIANEIRDITKKTELAVASGKSFADALSAAPALAKQQIPIILTDGDKPEFNTMNLNKLYSIDVKYVIGGENSVPNKFATATRIAGSDRYQTSVEVAKRFYKDSKNALLASGMVFPDGLSSISLAMKNDAPVLLTSRNSLPTSVDKYIKESKVESLTIVGGFGSVSSSIENDIKTTTNNAVLDKKNKELKAVVDSVKKGLELVDQNYVVVKADKMKDKEDQAKAKARIKDEIKELLTKAENVLNNKNATVQMYDDILTVVAPNGGLIGNNFAISAEIVGDKVVKLQAPEVNGKLPEAVATYTREDKNKDGGYDLSIKTSIKDLVRDDAKEVTDATKLTKYIKVEYLTKAEFEKINKDDKLVKYADDKVNVDVVSAKSLVSKYSYLRPVEKIKVGDKETEVDNYTVTPESNMYSISIRKMPADAYVVSPVLVYNLGPAGLLKYEGYVFVKQTPAATNAAGNQAGTANQAGSAATGSQAGSSTAANTVAGTGSSTAPSTTTTTGGIATSGVYTTAGR